MHYLKALVFFILFSLGLASIFVGIYMPDKAEPALKEVERYTGVALTVEPNSKVLDIYCNSDSVVIVHQSLSQSTATECKKGKSVSVALDSHSVFINPEVKL